MTSNLGNGAIQPPPARYSGAPRWVRDLFALYRPDRSTDNKLLRARVKSLLANEPTKYWGSVLTGLVYVAEVAKQPPPIELLLWIGAFIVYLCARLWVRRRLQESSNRDLRYWTIAYIGVLCSVGALWGSTAIVSTRIAPEATLFSMLWLVGVTVVFLSVFAILFELCVIYSVLSAGLPAVYFSFVTETMRPMDALAVLIGVTFMLAYAAHSNLRFARAHRLEIENDRLVSDLAREKRYVEELNELLRAELLRQDKAAEELRRAKDNAEDLARKLSILSALDGLTEIANRRQFEESLQREWARARRDGAPLALIICDIDYFKRYNDRYGHQAGDECLKRVARVLNSYCRRGGDVAARYGGEEFVLLLPTTEMDSAKRLAESIRADVRALAISHDASDVAPIVTASFGVSSAIPLADIRPEALVRAADRALYQAKRAGRDRVESLAPFATADWNAATDPV